MSYAPYPAYKESGIPWLGDVPEGWDVKRLKYVSTYNDEVLPETTDPDLLINYVDISSVSLVDGIQNVEQVEFEKAPSRARRIVREGDTVVSTVRTYLKAIAPIREPRKNMIVSTGFAVIRPSQMMNPDYLGYFVQSQGFIGEVVSKSTGVSYPAINPSDLVGITGIRPPIEEQTAIADFLDKKTAEIDGLIAKQEALLRLLAEQRTALITHAVTKGLNPNAPMKPSGIDWLGDVPEGWNIAPISTAIQRLESGVSVNAMDMPAEEEQLAVLKTSAVYSGTFDPTQNKTIYDDAEKNRLACQVRKGELIISRMNTPDLVGAVGLVKDHFPNLFLPDRLWQSVFWTNAKATPSFLYYYFNSRLYRTIIASVATGTSGSMKNISHSDLLKIKIAMPPLSLQREITIFLDEKLDSLSRTEEKIKEVTKHLREYRTALITNSVTGKIKVT